MKSVFLRSCIAVLILATLLSQASANPDLKESLCRIYGINCQGGEVGNSEPLLKTSSTLQADERVFSFFDPANWSPVFYPQGLSENVLGILAEGDSVYAAGVVGRADSTQTWGLALWDGREWSSPTKKPPFEMGWVSQIFKHNGKVHFCGAYLNDMPGSRFLASWNGQDWETRTLPHMDVIMSMTSWDAKLVLATYIDGLWQVEDSLVTPFQPKVEGLIREVTVQGGRLWVRGSFKLLGDTLWHGIAYLENGAWKVPSPIKSRAGLDWAWLGQEAFVIDGGSTSYPTIDPTVLLRWNGTEWSQISVDPSAGLLRLLASDGKQVYLVGTDRVVSNNYATVDEGLRISKWDGQKFNLVDRKNFQGRILQAKAINGRLILGGGFQKIGDVRADNLAMWDGNEWAPYSQQLRPGLAIPGSAAISWGDKLIFGGDGISMAGKIPVSNIAAWSESGWGALGGGIRAEEKLPPGGSIPHLGVKIASLAVHDGMLYAAGQFDTAGNRFARNIAQWDGKEWSPMGEGLPFEVAEILTNGPDLYAISGRRDTLQGGMQVSVRDVVHWNGAAWNSLGSLATRTFSSHLAYFNGALWTSTGASLAKWNGTGWEALNLGTEEISSLFTHKNALYITDVGKRLIKYQGNVLDTLPNVVYSEKFASDGENLFVSGKFDLPGFPNTTLARWDGMAWTPMADLFTNLDHMVVHGDYLYLILEWPTNRPTNFDPYLRWNRKTGTWNRADIRASGREKTSWRALPCVRDCFLSEREVIHGMYDVQGRNVIAGLKFRGKAAGIKVLKSGK